MKKLILALGIMLLVGCQTAAQFERNMITWRGQPIQSMIQQWGYPDGELTSPDGNKVYVYGNSGSIYIPQSTTYNTNANIIGNSVYSTTNSYSTGGYSVNVSCTIYVEFGEDKVIKNVSWRGNNCVA
ncbi:hypothetical protein AB8F75_08640 [Salmonella enterica]|uniref:Lipoprotein n=3 Tax=Salmonella enterica TaxID=28901 RepID=A0A8E6JSX2_SALTM|nr:hypothetical protein [Salmonella enterica]EBC9075930.1 hypothetical protein [Salmonella enterica subsp. enterica serovar Schwarzengrund]EDN4704856.1 hypothetical protein [Salmonella enterica subsp. enterica serovar Saintpaul]EDT5328723.1 hypothetical protein [Salmonella enterica subsp. enterica serovar 4,12:i:-]EFR5246736.1 hypothetical protein [Salmonella enterica subsp. enterica serovar Infantis]MBD6041893.1 hypothetical protein [Salmonella enterica subsp. enterica serovar Enteritidis]ME